MGRETVGVPMVEGDGRAQRVVRVRITARDMLGDPEAVVVAVVQPLDQPAAGPPPHAVHGED